MPIDYSKWDHLDEYSCSSHSDNNDNDNDNDNDDEKGKYRSSSTASSRSRPRVTRLDAPSRVTFGGQGNSGATPVVVETPQQPSVMTQKTSDTTSSTSNTTRMALSSNANEKEAIRKTTTSHSNNKSNNDENDKEFSLWTSKGGVLEFQDDNNNHRQLYWSQDRYSVSLRVQLLDDNHQKKEETIQSVQVDGILPYEDRHCAVMMSSSSSSASSLSNHPKLKIQTKLTTHATNNNNDDDKSLLSDGCCSSSTSTSTSTPIICIQGDLPHPVHLPQNETEVDWFIERRKCTDEKFVFITLFKAVPMQGVFLWWRRPWMQFDEMDIDRDNDNNNDKSKQSSFQKQQEFMHAWEEAHRMFREKKKNQKERPRVAL